MRRAAMLRGLMVLAVLGGLSACGVDGAPTPPGGGVGLSGEARVGVSGTL